MSSLHLIIFYLEPRHKKREMGERYWTSRSSRVSSLALINLYLPAPRRREGLFSKPSHHLSRHGKAIRLSIACLAQRTGAESCMLPVAREHPRDGIYISPRPQYQNRTCTSVVVDYFGSSMLNYMALSYLFPFSLGLGMSYHEF